jgi:flagellar basal-body rod modification protein FlgD
MSVNATDVFKDLGLATADQPKKKEQVLQQEQFLKLMTTQLTHQDPLKPMENGDFLGQMAQFSTVSGIQELQASFKDFASSLSSDQALQAASLVGRSVTAPGDQALLTVGSEVSGNFDLPDSSPSVNVKIVDPITGAVVKNINLGTHASGKVNFAWDGLNAEDELAPPGVYKIQVEAKIDGNNTLLPANINSEVESITMSNGSRGLQVNLASGEAIDFNKIKQIL